jgi:hypothetical protein
MCETGPINQQQGLKDDQEFGRTLSILAAVGISISASAKRTNIDNSQEPICLSRSDRKTRFP